MRDFFCDSTTRGSKKKWDKLPTLTSALPLPNVSSHQQNDWKNTSHRFCTALELHQLENANQNHFTFKSPLRTFPSALGAAYSSPGHKRLRPRWRLQVSFASLVISQICLKFMPLSKKRYNPQRKVVFHSLPIFQPWIFRCCTIQ